MRESLGKVRVDGLRDLEQTMQGLAKSTGRGILRRTGIKAMQPMAEIAQRLAPDDPATAAPEDLPTSIAVGTRSDGRLNLVKQDRGENAVTVYMGPTKDGYPQAIMQEFGTVNHAPQAYMRPAWDQDKGGLLDRVKKLLAVEIEKTARRLARRRARGK